MPSITTQHTLDHAGYDGYRCCCTYRCVRSVLLCSSWDFTCFPSWTDGTTVAIVFGSTWSAVVAAIFHVTRCTAWSLFLPWRRKRFVCIITTYIVRVMEVGSVCLSVFFLNEQQCSVFMKFSMKYWQKSQTLAYRWSFFPHLPGDTKPYSLAHKDT